MPGKRVWVIGDIHGMFDPLNRLLRRIRLVQQERPARETRLVFIGDYIDYGPSSREVLDALIRLRDEYECVFLAGNHEDLLQQFLRRDDLYRRFGNVWFRLNDGVETVASLVDDPARLGEFYAEGAAAAVTPENLGIPGRYLAFLNDLAYAHREQFSSGHRTLDFAFCHGLLERNDEAPDDTIVEGISAVEEQLSLRTYEQFHRYRRDRRKWIEDLHLWNRDATLGRYGNYILVHGHTPTVLLNRFQPNLGDYDCDSGLPFLGFAGQPPAVRVSGGFHINVDATLDTLATVDIDTGAVYGKSLTALLLDEQDLLNDFTISAFQVRLDRPHRHGQDLVHVEFSFLP